MHMKSGLLSHSQVRAVVKLLPLDGLGMVPLTSLDPLHVAGQGGKMKACLLPDHLDQVGHEGDRIALPHQLPLFSASLQEFQHHLDCLSNLCRSYSWIVQEHEILQNHTEVGLSTLNLWEIGAFIINNKRVFGKFFFQRRGPSWVLVSVHCGDLAGLLSLSTPSMRCTSIQRVSLVPASSPLGGRGFSECWWHIRVWTWPGPGLPGVLYLTVAWRGWAPQPLPPAFNGGVMVEAPAEAVPLGVTGVLTGCK